MIVWSKWQKIIQYPFNYELLKLLFNSYFTLKYDVIYRLKIKEIKAILFYNISKE
jgi:hypothetical protein